MYEESKIFRGVKVFKTPYYERTESLLKDKIAELKSQGYKAFIIGEVDKLSRGHGSGFSIWADEKWFNDENKKDTESNIKRVKAELNSLEVNYQKQLEKLKDDYERNMQLLQNRYKEMTAKYAADHGGAVVEKKRTSF